MLYINGRFLTQPLTGVNRFAYEITKALHKEGYEFTLICPHQDICDEYNVENFKIQYYGFGKSHIWELFSLPFFFLNKKNDILVSFSGLGPIFVKNKITTIHDLAHRENPKWYSFPYRTFYRIVEPLVVKSAQKIITVSEFSKGEILKYYKSITQDKIHVIYNACNDDWEFTGKRNLTSDYILCVSSIDPRKNFPILLDAFREIPEVKLKIVGGKNAVFSNDNLDIPSNAEFLGRVSDEELAELYQNAIAFIYPTLYEGFGLPPIEAAHFGCPTIISNIPVLKEVCGDTAVYFNPQDYRSIIDAVRYILTLTEEQREMLVASSKKNLERFSWRISAQRLIEMLQMPL